MKTTYIALALAMAVSFGCPSKEQVTRTGQNRPTAPAQTRVTVNTQDGMIPAGTELAIRVNQAIDTKDAGGVYRAEVAQDILDNAGKTIISRGSPAEVTVVQASSGGTVGTRTIELALRSVTVNGRQRMASTENVREEGPGGLGTNRRTAEMVGGGAALGAVVGAILGGGSGAAIGATGGAATQVLTRGDTVRIPAETVMEFRLASALDVR